MTHPRASIGEQAVLLLDRALTSSSEMKKACEWGGL